MERLQGYGPYGTAVPGQGDPCLCGGSYLSVERHTRHVLDTPDIAFLHTPDVLHAHFIQPSHTHKVPPICPSQLLQQPLDEAYGGLLTSCPPAAVKAQLLFTDAPVHQNVSKSWHTLLHQLFPLCLPQQAEVSSIPLKDPGRLASHEIGVDGMGIGGAANGHPPHKVPDVQSYVKVWPLPKPGLQLACCSLTHAAATVHIKQHWGWNGSLAVLLYYTSHHHVQSRLLLH